MKKFLVLLIPLIFCVCLSGCNFNLQQDRKVSSYNSERLNNMKKQYSQKVQIAETDGSQKYTYSDNVLKIDMK